MKYFLCCGKDDNYEIVESTKKPKTTSFGGKFWLVSRSYDTLQELKNQCKVQDYKCPECKGIVSFSNDEEDAEYQKENKVCKSCLHTLKRIDCSDSNLVIIDCVGYYIKPYNNSAPSHCLGFGGREFTIKKANGEIVTTNNLWHNGDIPKRFQKRLSNNAEFLT